MIPNFIILDYRESKYVRFAMLNNNFIIAYNHAFDDIIKRSQMDPTERFERLRVITQLKQLPSSKLKSVLQDTRDFKYKTLWQDEDERRKREDYHITDKWEKISGY